MEVQFSPELEGKLTRIAAEQGRKTESLVFEAVEILVGQLSDLDAWFIREVEMGLSAAERGEFKEHSGVRTLIDSRYPG